MAKAARKEVWPDEVGISHFAETIGISERRVYDLAKTGVVVRGSKPGTLLALQSMHGYLDYLRGRAADMPTAGRLRMEKVKTENITRQIQEIRLTELQAGLLTIDDLMTSWRDFVGPIKKALLSIPQIAIDSLPNLTAHDEVTIRQMVIDMLDGLVDEAEASVIAGDPELLKPTPADRAGIPRGRNRR